ncbi:hypothetical protein Tco_1290926 [Tanacetum coccineum]
MTQRLTLKLEAWLCRYVTLHAIYNLGLKYHCFAASELQMELLVVQTQLFNNRPTVVNTFHGSLQQPEPVQHLESQPIGSPALTNNTMNDSSLPNAVDYHNHAHPHPSIDPFQLSRSQSQNGDNDEENQDFVVFLDHILQSG